MLSHTCGRVISLALVTLFVFVPSARAGVIVIDDFESGSFSLTDTIIDNGAPGAVVPDLPLAETIGGLRGPSVLLTGGSSAVFSLDVTVGGDDAVVLRVPGGGKASAGLLYPGKDFLGLGGVDLTAGGGSAFLFTFAHDPGDGRLEMKLNEGLASETVAEIRLTGLSTYSVPFAAFGGSGSTLNAIESIFVLLEYASLPDGTTVELSDIRIGTSAVPEPSTTAALIFGAMVLLGCRWRRHAPCG